MSQRSRCRRVAASPHTRIAFRYSGDPTLASLSRRRISGTSRSASFRASREALRTSLSGASSSVRARSPSARCIVLEPSRSNSMPTSSSASTAWSAPWSAPVGASAFPEEAPAKAGPEPTKYSRCERICVRVYTNQEPGRTIERPERRGVIEEAKAKVSTIDLADRLCGPAGSLRRAGENWTGRCPLPDHGDRTPSFYVYEESNSFFCFGCLEGGDVVKLARHAWGF